MLTAELDAGIRTIRLDKPHALNALCTELAGRLRDAIAEAAADAATRVVVLTGTGRAFCAGSDLGAPVPVANLTSAGRGDLLLSEYFNPLIRDLRDLPKPLVVAVNGLAVGGGVGLALAGDVVIAAASASFRLDFGPRLGLVPDMGCTWWLPQAVGRARALGTVLTGRPIDAAQALDWGLIWDVVDDAALPAAAAEVARGLAAAPAGALVAARRLIDGAGLAAQLDRERDAQVELMAGPDFAEGVRAFKEKRAPRWT